jgi:hypothetical protein
MKIMKLDELRLRVGKIKFKSQKDRKFYNKYQYEDCVICYFKKTWFPFCLYAIIKGEDKYHAFRLNNDNRFVIIEVDEAYKTIEKMGMIIIKNKELGEMKKLLIVEALGKGIKEG